MEVHRDAVRILLVDDQNLFRQSLRYMLGQQKGFAVVGEARDGIEAVEKARELVPDIVLMDVQMPNCGGLEALRQLRQELPAIRVVMLTVSEGDEELFAAIKAGAKGYLLKSMETDELFRAIEHIQKGEAVISPLMAVRLLAEFAGSEARGRSGEGAESDVQPLTAREKAILEYVRRGCTNKQIAASLCIAETTVKTHLRNILEKLHLQNRAQVAVYATGSKLDDRRPPR